jgi:hypothetical protein
MIGSSDMLKIGSRLCIHLDWGAKLYTFDSNLIDKIIPKLKPLNWKISSKRLMTSFVVSLELLKVVTDSLDIHHSIWNVKHIEQFFLSISVVFWHAFSFNTNSQLRTNLCSLKFMKQQDSYIPHLLDQEVRALSLMQFLVIKCYKFDSNLPLSFSGSPNEFHIFASVWVER